MTSFEERNQITKNTCSRISTKKPVIFGKVKLCRQKGRFSWFSELRGLVYWPVWQGKNGCIAIRGTTQLAF